MIWFLDKHKEVFNELTIRLVREKTEHLSSILEFKYGIPTKLSVDAESEHIVLFTRCQRCGELNYLAEYTTGDAILINAEVEAGRVANEFANR